jgi:hypothetical protein
LEWFETRRYRIAIAFELYFRERHWEGPGKPGWLEIKWYTSADYAYDNIMGGSVHTIKKNVEALAVARK